MSKYEDIMARKDEILKASLGMDYRTFELGGIAFNYEALMQAGGISDEEIKAIQHEANVGSTPLIELKNLTAYARRFAKKGKGARIFLKDEAQNVSGSFKARRAAISVYMAKKLGYRGVVAATSGNYGAAVAALAAKAGLKCIIVQECYDASFTGQPEILEKARACEAFGAEVVQVTVGPELFMTFLHILDETKYFNASLYSPYGVRGIETLGEEIAHELFIKEKKYPEAVICTHAGGGNLTGTARGLKRAGAVNTRIIGASVDLTGLHMASDTDFNKKSFTTGHTGFGIPFATQPDRSDVMRSAARPLRYMDAYLLINQGSVFFITEALARLEGLERGPAGNISLAVAFAYAQTMDADDILVVQESEYTGAGKHVSAQVSFAKDNGIDLIVGDPLTEVPGKNIVFPSSAGLITYKEVPLEKLQTSYLKHFQDKTLTPLEYTYLMQELRVDETTLKRLRGER